MNNKEQAFEWEDLKDMWGRSSHTRKISLEVSRLVEELKNKTSQFEKNSISADIALLEASWAQSQSKVSQFEKEAIARDLTMIKRFLKKFLDLFK